MLGDEKAAKRLMNKFADIQKLGYTYGEYEGIEEQLPAFFYMDKDMKILSAHYAKGLGDMPKAEEMLAM